MMRAALCLALALGVLGCRPEAAPGLSGKQDGLWLERRLLLSDSRLAVDPAYRERGFRGLVRFAIGEDETPNRIRGGYVASMSKDRKDGVFNIRRAVLLRGETALHSPELKLGKAPLLAFDTAALAALRARDFFRPEAYLQIDVRAKSGDTRSFALDLPAADEAWHPQRVSLAALAGQSVTITVRLGGVLRDRDDHVLLADLGLYEAERPKDDDRQNVIVIWLDKTRADLLEQAGADPALMPSFNELAKHGVSFTSARSNSNLTHRSTSQTLLSSLYTEALAGERFKDPHALPRGVPSLPSELGKRGWYIANLGANVHVTRIPDGVGSRQNDMGFDFSRADLRTQLGADPKLLSDQVEPWISGELREPFFLNLHFQGGHEPYEKPKEKGALWEKALAKANGDVVGARYVMKAHEADAVLGQTVELLRKRGLLERTLLVVLSDHGTTLGLKHHFFQWKTRWDTRTSHPVDLYDEQLRVPIVFLHPRLPARRVDERVALLDVAPTILQFLGLPVPRSFEGLAFTPLLEGKPFEPARVHMMANETVKLYGVIEYPWKFLYALEPLQRWYIAKGAKVKPDFYMVDAEDRQRFDYQLRRYAAEGLPIGERQVVQEQLYNLELDPDEQTNLVTTELDTAQRLRKLVLGSVMNQTIAPFEADEARQVLAFSAPSPATFAGRVSSTGPLKLGNPFGACEGLELEQLDRQTVQFKCRAGSRLAGFELYRRAQDGLRFEIKRDGTPLTPGDYFFGADALPDLRAVAAADAEAPAAVLVAASAMPPVTDSAPELIEGSDQGAFFFRMVSRASGSDLGGERLQRAFAAWGYGQ